ncbi:hypothetical protein [Sulfodiicoccus acidiphilus]|uniref:hypothetical protein n=1 Tax=Sulfodiicoccus acidiphilus TaxID=1670455 RepID=UPI001315608D|nr:hypothetical protein [Sulfodiicoccus acidiphilus]
MLDCELQRNETPEGVDLMDYSVALDLFAQAKVLTPDETRVVLFGVLRLVSPFIR